MTALRLAGGRPLRGQVRVPGDKSVSHRALMLAALAPGTSVLRGLSTGDDVAATAAAVRLMGAQVDRERVEGGPDRLHEPERVVDVGNSGTTIRLLAGMCAAFDWLTVLTGDRSIARRPMDRVTEPVRAMGASVDGRQGGRFAPLVVRGGGLKAIEYAPPVASAQVKSAVLLAGLGAEGETVVHEPVPTRAHTEELLALAGADVRVDGTRVRLRPSPLCPFELDVPGDPSQAAFWVVAACLVPGSELTVDDVYLGPARDGFLAVLDRMGAAVEVEPSGTRRARLRARHSPGLRATRVAAEEVPGLIDEIPVLAVAATAAEGTTEFAGAGELRVKESDRLATVTQGLAALGARVEAGPDGLAVTGPTALRAARVQSCGDHRVAMALAVAGLTMAEETTIEGWEAVATSYPGFAEALRACRW